MVPLHMGEHARKGNCKQYMVWPKAMAWCDISSGMLLAGLHQSLGHLGAATQDVKPHLLKRGRPLGGTS